jgi:hypothetical protein
MSPSFQQLPDYEIFAMRAIMFRQAALICVVPLILGGTVAQSQEAPMFGAGGGPVLVQRTDQTGRRTGTPTSQQKEPMSR